MPEKRTSGNRGKLISRAAAAEMLLCSPLTVDKLAEKHGVEVFQVKGHSRRWYSADGIRGLVDGASGSPKGGGRNA
jgi:hypothetical protein